MGFNRKDILDFLKYASEQVSKMSNWKKNILEVSGKPFNKYARNSIIIKIDESKMLEMVRCDYGLSRVYGEKYIPLQNPKTYDILTIHTEDSFNAQDERMGIWDK